MAGDDMAWPGVNCGLSVSRKPVSTNDSRLDVVGVWSDAVGITDRRSAFFDISVMLRDNGVVFSLVVAR